MGFDNYFIAISFGKNICEGFSSNVVDDQGRNFYRSECIYLRHGLNA